MKVTSIQTNRSGNLWRNPWMLEKLMTKKNIKIVLMRLKLTSIIRIPIQDRLLELQMLINLKNTIPKFRQKEKVKVVNNSYSLHYY